MEVIQEDFLPISFNTINSPKKWEELLENFRNLDFTDNSQIDIFLAKSQSLYICCQKMRNNIYILDRISSYMNLLEDLTNAINDFMVGSPNFKYVRLNVSKCLNDFKYLYDNIRYDRSSNYETNENWWNH